MNQVVRKEKLPFAGCPMPLYVRWEADRPVVGWCDFQDMAFTDPFFMDTFLRLTEMFPKRRTWETGIEGLLEPVISERAEPSGFIFQMSRCGSTLISRLLGASSRFLSLGEPDALLGMLEFPSSISPEKRREWVRALILALGGARRPTHAGYVIKFTSFHVFHLPLIREAFPETPWVFVFRDPISVMRSVLRTPTGFMLMQASPSRAAPYLAMPPAAVAALSKEEYLAQFLARMLRFALAQGSGAESRHVRFIDYRSLPEAIWNEVSPFFGVSPNVEEQERMERLSLVYSKDPTGRRRFDPRATETNNDLSEKAKNAADRWLVDPYREVQEMALKLRAS